ncbi:hypothetical protein [Geobacter sp.]|uniref:hypothetical protein n=1 Tax=Geobacter sp. TaxID=46610 RepID=UPI00260DB944|nr:hypothetical protein [Geobacter sp.]
MKSMCLGLTLMFLASNAFAGTAFIPTYISEPQNKPNRTITLIMVGNASNVTQKVTLTFYTHDGSPLSGHSMRYWGPSNVPSYTNVLTDSLGQVSIDLPPYGQVQYQLWGEASTHREGFGTITGQATTGSGFLIAHAAAQNLDGSGTGNNYYLSIPINGGQPF